MLPVCGPIPANYTPEYEPWSRDLCILRAVQILVCRGQCPLSSLWRPHKAPCDHGSCHHPASRPGTASPADNNNDCLTIIIIAFIIIISGAEEIHYTCECCSFIIVKTGTCMCALYSLLSALTRECMLSSRLYSNLMFA